MKLVLFSLILCSTSVSFSANTPDVKTSGKMKKATVLSVDYCGFPKLQSCTEALGDLRKSGSAAFLESQNCQTGDGVGSEPSLSFTE